MTRMGWTREGLITVARKTPKQANWAMIQDLADALEAAIAEAEYHREQAIMTATAAERHRAVCRDREAPPLDGDQGDDDA